MHCHYGPPILPVVSALITISNASAYQISAQSENAQLSYSDLSFWLGSIPERGWGWGVDLYCRFFAEMSELANHRRFASLFYILDVLL